MIKKDQLKYYRLAIFNENMGAEVTNFMASDDFFAIQHANNIYSIMPNHYGCILFKYDRLDTCGPFRRIATIEEPKAIE